MRFWKKKNQVLQEKLNDDVLKGLSDLESQLMAPPTLAERMPGEKGATDYWVEVSDNTGGARYLKTWLARWSGRTTWTGMLDPILLHEGDGEVDMTIHVEPAEADVMMNRLAQRIAVLQADLMRESHPLKVGTMQQEIMDLESQLARLRVNAEKLFRTSMVMTVSGSTPEKLRRVSRSLLKRMGGVGMLFRSADTRQLEAWRHSFGIGKRSEFDDAYMNMESSNVADAFIYGYGGLSHRKGVLIGWDHYNRPVFYDGWDGRLANQHMVIFGRAGAGKSFSIKVITRRSAAALGIRTGIIDPDREYKNLVVAMDGAYAELSPKHENFHRINIYDVEEEEDEHGRILVNLDEAMKAVQAVLFKMVRIFDENLLTGQVKVAIHDTIQDLYNNHWGITTNPNSLYQQTDNGWEKKVMPTLYDHYLLMKEHPELQHVAPIIKLFTREGGDSSKAIFDGHSTFHIGDSQVFGISVADLDDDIMKPLGIFIATKWCWERFAKKNRAQKKRLIVDEAQLMMENPEEAKWLENAYRRGRKLNVSMCAVTQGFEVFLRVPEGMGILKNAPTKLLLRQESIDIETVSGKFNLSEGEGRFLLTASAGLGILKVDEESTIVRIQPTETEYWLYTTNPNDLVEERSTP